LRSSWGDAVVLLATFLLTIFRDLTEGILVGFALGAVLFINRMAQTTDVARDAPLVPTDKADDANGERAPYDAGLANDPDVVVYRITGAFFFGAASSVGSVLDGIVDRHKAFIIDFAAVPFLDSTAANAISRTAEKARRRGVRVFITGTSQSVRRALLTHGVRPPRVKYRADIANAVAEIKTHLAEMRSASQVTALH
jgi:SulP family sulfate permease